jgi:hypothetical protein
VAVAAAAAVCLVLLYGPQRPDEPLPRPPTERAAEQVVEGQVLDALGQPVERLVSGRPYVAYTDAAVEDERGLFLIQRGTAFAPASEGAVAMSVESGAVLGQVPRRDEAVEVEVAPGRVGAVVRTRGGQFYTSGVAGDGDWVVVHVFGGRLEIDAGQRKLSLGRGDSAIVAASGAIGSTGEVEARVEALRKALGRDVLAQRRRLQRRSDAYARLVAQHPGLAALDAAEAQLDRLYSLSDTATNELGRMVLASAR